MAQALWRLLSSVQSWIGPDTVAKSDKYLRYLGTLVFPTLICDSSGTEYRTSFFLIVPILLRSLPRRNQKENERGRRTTLTSTGGVELEPTSDAGAQGEKEKKKGKKKSVGDDNNEMRPCSDITTVLTRLQLSI
jgi:hypothetical protein